MQTVLLTLEGSQWSVLQRWAEHTEIMYNMYQNDKCNNDCMQTSCSLQINLIFHYFYIMPHAATIYHYVTTCTKIEARFNPPLPAHTAHKAHITNIPKPSIVDPNKAMLYFAIAYCHSTSESSV